MKQLNSLAQLSATRNAPGEHLLAITLQLAELAYAESITYEEHRITYLSLPTCLPLQ